MTLSSIERTGDGSVWRTDGGTGAVLARAPTRGLGKTYLIGHRETYLIAEGPIQRSGLMVDIDRYFKSEGFLRLAHMAERFDLLWLEYDFFDAGALAAIRQKEQTPILSGELLYSREAFRSFLEKHAADVTIVDVIWNGILEGIGIAHMAEPYKLNVAPHDFRGPLAA